MICRPASSTRADPLFPYSSPFLAHECAVHLGQVPLGRRRVVLDDGLGLLRAMRADMGHGLVDALHHAGGDDGVEIFGAPVFRARRLDARIECRSEDTPSVLT